MNYLDRLKTYQGQRGKGIDDLRHALGILLAEVDRDGRPWTGFSDNLTQEERSALKMIVDKIDAAVSADDKIGAAQVFIDYKRLVLAARQRQETQTGQSCAVDV